MNTNLTLEAAAAAALGMEAAGAENHLDLGDGMHSLALGDGITIGTEITSAGSISFMLFDGPDQIGEREVSAWLTDADMTRTAAEWTTEILADLLGLPADADACTFEQARVARFN